MADFFARYLRKFPKQTRSILLTCLYGVAAGVAAVVFQSAITLLSGQTYERMAQQTPWHFYVGSFAVIVGGSLFVGWLLTSFCPSAAGSGIPQLKVAFWKDFGAVAWRVVWVKFVGGVISIGTGSSLGREGPSVQLAGGLASNLGALAGEPKQARRTAAAAGAAAGLAAAFNTPLAATTFVLEELIADLNSRYLGSVLLASVIGALVVHGVIGKQPAFTLGSVDALSWQVYPLVPVVAALASIVGVLFQKWTLGLRANRSHFEPLPRWMHPAIGGVVTWALGSIVFSQTGHLGVFGIGYGDLSAALTGHLAWELAGVLLIAKLLATTACFGCGGCGGIFSPTLFFGGMCGLFLAGLSGHFMHLTAEDGTFLAVTGMSACLGTVVRAPVTGIVIVFEMTHEFAVVPALMVGALISQAIGRRMNKLSFYEEILEQDGHQIEHVIPPRDLQSWQELRVSAIANFRPVSITADDLTHLQNVLDEHPYHGFPVAKDERPIGIVRREEIEAAIAQNRPLQPLPPVFGLPVQTIRELQTLLLESKTGLVILLDKPDGKMIGLVTLHDLLRAQVSIVERAQH